MELADIRSVEVDKRVFNESGSATSLSRLLPAPTMLSVSTKSQPNLAAETIRKARLKRMA